MTKEKNKLFTKTQRNHINKIKKIIHKLVINGQFKKADDFMQKICPILSPLTIYIMGVCLV
jgi:hypothetical protein